MIVARSFEELAAERPALLTIGTFDGVHRGHRLLLAEAQRRARERGLDVVIVTFDPNPAIVLRSGLRRYQLSGSETKLRLLAEFAPACVLMLPFTLALSHLSAAEFMDALESRIVIQELWLGEDFRFGRGREGDPRFLAERGARHGFALHVVERRADDPTGISSSRVRQALAEGDMDLATRLLGYPFCLQSSEARTVEEFAGLYLHRYAMDDAQALPADGAYALILSRPAGQALPAAGVVEGAVPLCLTAITGRAFAGSYLIEFIARLGDVGGTPTDLHRAALAVAASWTRPVYPPAGRL
jgi:riboflavin kinase/FMN adenylyltransferase